MNIKPLLYWVKEREKIRLKKIENKPAPWTKDPILQTYRFCNIRRRDDRVSSWLIANVLTKEHMDFDLQSFLQFSAWCRWVNWPPTIAAVLDKGWYPAKRIDWTRIGRFLDSKSDKTWTGAYMILAPRPPFKKKGSFVSKQVIGKSFTSVLPQLMPMLVTDKVRVTRQVWELLQTCNYFGSFMAGQVVADWTYTPLLSRASDLYTWAPMGPGSVRGYNRLLGKTPITKRPSEEDWCWNLKEWRGRVVKAFGSEYASLTMMDVQNALCETDKYLRVKNGEGRPRAKYQPHGY